MPIDHHFGFFRCIKVSSYLVLKRRSILSVGGVIRREERERERELVFLAFLSHI